jgi:isoleucyl-tRNA synthetase
VERTEKEGWAVAASDGATVALDIELDDDLRRQGRVYDVIHKVNNLRKETGLELTDRIDLLLASSDADLLEHADWIGAETLALSVGVSDKDEIRITRR